MRFPFFGRQGAEEPERVPLPEMLSVGFGVYYRPEDAPPDEDDLRAAILAWLEDHAPGQMRSRIRTFVESQFFGLSLGECDMLPAPPVDVLRWFRPGELEERRFVEATHLALVSAPDTPAQPRLGFWAALAGARALAHALRGVILDPDVPRLLPLETYEAPVPADGRIIVPDHVLIPVSSGRRGLAWMTTKGMRKLGLPELELRGVPPHLEDAAANVINGMAGHLLAEAARWSQGPRPRELSLGPEIRLTLADIARARGAGDAPEPPPGARGWALIRLEYHPSRRGDSFLRLLPPRGFRGEPGVWLSGVLSDLLGSGADEVAAVPSGSEAMEAAHRRAVAELPDAKRRFQAGLREGEALLVKHGFVSGADTEFMWLNVTAWVGDCVRGHLISRPLSRADLRPGQSVEVREADVYDWIIAHDGGELEGGYTNRAAQQEGEEPAPPI